MNLLKNFARSGAVALLLALAAPVFGAGTPLGAGVAQADVVNRISVQGNKRVEAATIINYITIKVGKQFGPAEIDSSIKSLYGTGLFSDVSMSRSGSTLVVVVVESPIVNRVLFEGNKKVKNNILVTMVDTKPRGVLNDATLQGDVKRIQDYYTHVGRGETSVEPRITQLDNNRVDITFVIADGRRQGIRSITFVGNRAFSSGRLRGLMQTRATNIMSWLNKRDVYDEAKLAADQDALRRFYMSHGYADFRVLSAEANFDDVKGKYFIVVHRR